MYAMIMRVSIWLIRRAGSLVYLAGSMREATPYLIAIFTNLRENKKTTQKSEYYNLRTKAVFNKVLINETIMLK